MSSLSVPIALAPDGSLVRPDAADSETQYRCPGCGVPLVLRRGRARRPHFAHPRGADCLGESGLHRAAKRRIVEVVSRWKTEGGPRPCIARPCPTPGCPGGIVQDLPERVTHARPEVRLADGTVADVALFEGRNVAAVIEILVTHPVGRAKASRLRHPWVELDATAVLETPHWWTALQDGLRPFRCPTCAARDRSASDELEAIDYRARRLAVRLGIVLPDNPPYRYADHRCWRCEGDMIVYVWPGGGHHCDVRPPPPVPATVEHRVTDGGGDYWANVCPRCGSVQGDYYLARDNVRYARVMEASTLD